MIAMESVAAGAPRHDDRSMRQWIDRLRAKHFVRRPWKMPFIACACGKWRMTAPDDIGIVRQRDFLLDAFNEHLGVVRQERKDYLAKRRAQRSAVQKSDGAAEQR